MRPLPRAMPALITPFDDVGDVDASAHAHNLEVIRSWGFGGVLIGGSTGEGPYLEPGERHRLVAAARTYDWFVLCGVAAETTRTASHRIAEAADAGADAALVLTPTTLVLGDTDAVVAHYLDLVEDSPIPLLAYSVPKWSGYRLPPDTSRALADAGFLGLKDSGGDSAATAEAIRSGGPGWAVFVGASVAVAPGMADGAAGAITASANYAPELVLGATADTGRDHFQARLTELAPPIEQYGIAGVKWAASLMGLRPGRSRKPLRELPEPAMRHVTEVLEASRQPS